MCFWISYYPLQLCIQAVGNIHLALLDTLIFKTHLRAFWNFIPKASYFPSSNHLKKVRTKIATFNNVCAHTCVLTKLVIFVCVCVSGLPDGLLGDQIRQFGSFGIASGLQFFYLVFCVCVWTYCKGKKLQYRVSQV